MFNAADQRDLDAYLASAEFQNSLREMEQEFIYDFLSALKSKGHDSRTICGMILANLVQVHTTTLRDWQDEKSRSKR